MNPEKPKCGTCGSFDTKNAENNPFGQAVIDGIAINKGVCRINGGLIFGVLNEDTQCRQPEGVYSPKEIIATAVTS